MAEETLNNNGVDEGVETTTETTTQAPQTYSQSELDSAADKRAAKAVEAARAKWEAEQAKAVEAAKSEGARLAKMSADEKAQELEKQRQAALDKREAELNARELATSTKSLLSDKGLPTDLSGSLVALGDAEKIKAAVETLGSSLEKAVNERVEKQLQTTPPKNGASALGDADDPFNKIINSYKKK